MLFVNTYTAVWSVLNIAVYAAFFSSTKAVLADLKKPHAQQLAVLEPWLAYAGLLGALVVGIVADKVSARAAVSITNLASFAIYSAAWFLLTDSNAPRELIFVVAGATALQHTMQAMTTLSCIRMGHSASGALSLSTVLQIAVGYGAGDILGHLYSDLVHPHDLILAAAASTLFCFIVSYVVPSPRAVMVGHTASGSLKAIPAPGAKRSFPTVLFRLLPTIVFVAVMRFTRVLVLSSRSLLIVRSPIWQTWPLPFDLAVAVATNLFIIPGVLLFCRGPGTVLAATLLALGAVRGAMAYDPQLGQDDRYAPFFMVALTSIATMLYIVPTAFVGISADVGTKGRAMSIAAVVSAAIFMHKDEIQRQLFDAARRIAPSVTPLSLTTNELDFGVTAALLIVALAMLPSLATSRNSPFARGIMPPSPKPLSLHRARGRSRSPSTSRLPAAVAAKNAKAAAAAATTTKAPAAAAAQGAKPALVREESAEKAKPQAAATRPVLRSAAESVPPTTPSSPPTSQKGVQRTK
jgi:hypothetical protein